MAKYMHRSVAAWLCGLYDGDRSVVESTQNSLRQVFSTPEKIQNIRKAYQQPILDFCREAIDKESAMTLSDARVVSQEDAQTKYSRVISACVSLLGSLLANLQPEELSKHRTEYDGLLKDRKLWDFASYDDASVRRSIHRFLKICLEKEPAGIQESLEPLSKSYLSVALNSDQTSSVLDYIGTLTLLTSTYPSVWTEYYTSKTSVHRRLRQFLKKGSQLGPRSFWTQLVQLFSLLPEDILPNTVTDAVELLNAVLDGITRNEELKINHSAAFSAYVEIFGRVISRLPKDDQTKLLRELIWPFFMQYLQPTPETAQWTIPHNATVEIFTKVLRMDEMVVLVEENWPSVMQALIDNIKTSAPEQSKEYERSQTAVIQHAARLATLQDLILEKAAFASAQPALVSSISAVIREALQVVKTRKGKPYGAAGAVATLLRHERSFSDLPPPAKQDIERFTLEDLPDLLTSPSATYLIDLLYATSNTAQFKKAWAAALQVILGDIDSASKTKALEALLTSPRIPSSFDLAMHAPELQEYIKAIVKEAIEGLVEWDSFDLILQSQTKTKIMTSDTTTDVLTNLMESLSISPHATYSLQGIRHVVKSNPSLLKDFVSSTRGNDLLQALLRASESPDDETAQGAVAVSASIRTVLASGTDTTQSIYDVIQHGLQEASSASVSVETLVGLARQSIQIESVWSDIDKVLPTVDSWNAALVHFLNAAPKSSLAITNPLGGAVYLAEPTEPHSANKIRALSRDSYGYSAAFRIAQYVTKLFQHADLFPADKIPDVVLAAYLHNTTLTVQLSHDNLGLAGSNGLWAEHNHDVETDAMTFIADAQKFISQELKRSAALWSSEKANSSLLTWATDCMSKIDNDNSPSTYYDARVYGVLVADAVETAGWKTSQSGQLQDLLKSVQKRKDDFALLGFLHAFEEPLAASQSCERMCNEVVADLTGLNIEQKPEEGLRRLVLLNSVLRQDGIVHTIAKQRLVFFVKHVLPWLQNRVVTRLVQAELCRALTVLLPLMSDMYGEHWNEVLSFLSVAWSSTQELQETETGADRFVIIRFRHTRILICHSPIPFVHASLKLYAKLQTLMQIEEPNDDLIDAWKDTTQDIANGLINLLKHSQHFPDEFHQPLKMVNNVLARQISRISLKHLESTDELFPLLYVESQNVQQTAFSILHKQIPAAQEQISIDSALEKTTARLPEELLSLIIDAPTFRAFTEVNLERSTPLPLRGYLLSWLLVFDHLEHASFKVKNDYVEHIKEGDYLPGLLNFTFDFLGHARNKPADVSKFDVTTYQHDLETPIKDLQWLLTHLYYLSLRHIPSLTKTWFIDCKSRATVVTLEPWTEKFVSRVLPGFE